MPSNPNVRRFVIVDGCTIRETRDKQEEARPKKRQRVDSDESDGEEKDDGGKRSRSGRVFPTFSPLEKDKVYYLDEEDAECIVRVEKTLFKVHEDLLYASIPIRDHCKMLGKTSDYRPVELLAATLEEFRALLWALYTPAPDCKPEEEPHTVEEVNRILSIASVSYKYEFIDLNDWAFTAILEAIYNEVFMESCSSATLTRMADVAAQCKLSDVLSAIEKKWSERVAKNGTPSVPAMLAADKHNLMKLRGISYYTHIQDMLDGQVQTAGTGATQLRTDPKLNNGQVIRVLSGYWSLVNFWERFRQKPVKLPCGTGCSAEAHEACISTWEKRWSSAIGWKRILGYNSADILALLACLHDQLKGDDELKSATHADCRLAGLEALKKKLEDAKAGLTDHFFGCV